MKKIIFSLTLGLLLLLSMTVHAKTEEWINKSYDFTKLKTIAVNLNIRGELYNGIRENEIGETFFLTLKKELYDKLSPKKYRLVEYSRLINDFTKENNLENINIGNLPTDKKNELDAKFIEYVRGKTDAVINCFVWIYDLGTSYHEGYYYTLPSQTFSTITTNIGVTGNVNTYGQALYYKPGGNYPTAYCLVRWDIVDSKDNKPIWSRIDDRARVNMDAFQNTKPKSLLGRIVKSMSNDLLTHMKISNR